MNRASGLLERFLETAPSFIFLGGVHGVGKTTICNQMFIPAGYHCVTASSLIKKSGVRTDQNKRVEKVADSQILLLKQLAFKKRQNDRLLLDGHYCVINSQDQFDPIDIDVFRKMNPSAFVLLKGCPGEIEKRLKDRDGKEWDKSFVEQFQKAEEQHAKCIAYELNTPLQIVALDMPWNRTR